jgi:anti-sigma factor RsiW
MTCEDFAARLTAFGLGELPEAQAAAAREHVAGCDRCASLLLRDRELVGRLRASAVPAPAGVQRAVRVVLRRERLLRRQRLLRRAGAVAAAAALVGVVTFAPPVERVPPAQPAAPEAEAEAGTGSGGPLAAAWSAYQAPLLPLDRVGAGDPLLLGFVPVVPDLDRLGLRLAVSGTLRLAGRQAFATEYRSASGTRLAVFRWKGTLPETGEDYPSGARPELQLTRTGLTSSAWWDDGEVVHCAVGDLDQPLFERALARLRRAS